MGKATGFLEINRIDEDCKSSQERIKDYKEFTIPLDSEVLQGQSARCMDCGIPFCHSGCPLGNLIPDFNDAVYRGEWQKAATILHATNNFPEFTGRLCPAPCEEACVLNINADPVSIETIEKNIVERAFKEDWVQPQIPQNRSGKRVAVIGSGPSGLAAAQQLNRVGHLVTVFERDLKIGGLLRYGIPDFKMEKWVIDRRLDVLKQEGIVFKTGVHVGQDITIEALKSEFDAIVLCGGATKRRGIPIKGAHLKGVYQAMDFLKQSNQRQDDIKINDDEILATQKKVIVIGGGDTGSDCIGTSNRQGAQSVINFEIMERPSKSRPLDQPWPYYPMCLRTSSSHKEGVDRVFSISTKEFIGNQEGVLTGVITSEVAWKTDSKGSRQLYEVAGTEKLWPCDLVLIALGFTGPEKTLINQLQLETDPRGNVLTQQYATSAKGIFAAGDMRRGQSLIVWAISEGRQAAHYVDSYLMGSSRLPLKNESHDLPRK